MFAEYVPQLYDRGWRSLIPVYPRLKRPVHKRWQNYNLQPPSKAELSGWLSRYRTCAIGLAFGPDKVVGLDLDWLDPGKAERAWDLTMAIAGETPLIRVGRAPKRLALYRRDPDLGTISRKFGGFEVFTVSGQCLLFGLHPDTQQPYHWLGETPAGVGPDALPLLPKAKLHQLIDALEALDPEAAKAMNGASRAPASTRQGGPTARYLRALHGVVDAELPAAAAWLLARVPGGQRHDSMMALVMTLTMRGLSDRVIYTALVDVYDHVQHDMGSNQAEIELTNAIAWARQRHGPDDTELNLNLTLLFARLTEDWERRQRP